MRVVPIYAVEHTWLCPLAVLNRKMATMITKIIAQMWRLLEIGTRNPFQLISMHYPCQWETLAQNKTRDGNGSEKLTKIPVGHEDG